MDVHVEPRPRQEKRQRLANAITLLANDKYGREFLRWLLDCSGLMRSAGAPVDIGRAGYCEGQRYMGERVLSLVFEAKLPAEQMADIIREDDNG